MTQMERFADWLLETRLGRLTQWIIAIPLSLAIVYSLFAVFASTLN